ncbi:MAG: tRNA pseudouridine(55) synthase TruB [Proteobacteria bacterium]|nr:tRNA pseudouridine(55) synthase TruB [Pseudomonadota bacterium]
MDEAVLVIDKSAGPTSFDVVREVRNFTKIKKVGHAGTLDPFATGALVLLTGRATKLSNALINADKRYYGVIKLGEATDTLDLTGQVVERGTVPEFEKADVESVLSKFKGEWSQLPPMYSAKKIQGVRLYELARKNMSVRREAIAVQLYDLKLISLKTGCLAFEVHCSKGTYVRTLADEIARKLGTVGHLVELRRLSCGPFSLEGAFTLESLLSGSCDWESVGYRNYVKLLSAEGVVGSRKPGKNIEEQPINGQYSNQLGSQFSYLPRRSNSGMSLLD